MDEKTFQAVQRIAPGLYRLKLGSAYDPIALQMMASVIRLIAVQHLPTPAVADKG